MSGAKHAVKKVGHAVKSVVKAANPFKTVKTVVKSTKQLMHGDIRGAIGTTLGYGLNAATGGYYGSKVRRIGEAYQKQAAEMKANEEANELRYQQRQQSSALAEQRQANPYEADSSSLLEAKDNMSRQSTLLTGILGVDPDEMRLGRKSLLGGGQ